MRRGIRYTSTLTAIIGVAVLTACPRDRNASAEVEAAPEEQVAFFESIRERCGDAYPGQTQFVAIPDSPMANARLVMYIESCTDSVIRIPFVVDQDHSRTWVLTLTSGGLLFKHDHRHADGTPEDTTNYGGWATAEGTATTQHFPADEETAQMIPPAATNVWTLSLDPATSRFVYDLQRDAAPRFRAEFDLTTPVSPPQHP